MATNVALLPELGLTLTHISLHMYALAHFSIPPGKFIYNSRADGRAVEENVERIWLNIE